MIPLTVVTVCFCLELYFWRGLLQNDIVVQCALNPSGEGYTDVTFVSATITYPTVTETDVTFTYGHNFAGVTIFYIFFFAITYFLSHFYHVQPKEQCRQCKCVYWVKLLYVALLVIVLVRGPHPADRRSLNAGQTQQQPT